MWINNADYLSNLKILRLFSSFDQRKLVYLINPQMTMNEEYIPPGGILPMGGLGGGGPLIGAPMAPAGGPGIELGTETGGACCGGAPVKCTCRG